MAVSPRICIPYAGLACLPLLGGTTKSLFAAFTGGSASEAPKPITCLRALPRAFTGHASARLPTIILPQPPSLLLEQTLPTLRRRQSKVHGVKTPNSHSSAGLHSASYFFSPVSMLDRGLCIQSMVLLTLEQLQICTQAAPSCHEAATLAARHNGFSK